MKQRVPREHEAAGRHNPCRTRAPTKGPVAWARRGAAFAGPASARWGVAQRIRPNGVGAVESQMSATAIVRLCPLLCHSYHKLVAAESGQAGHVVRHAGRSGTLRIAAAAAELPRRASPMAATEREEQFAEDSDVVPDDAGEGAREHAFAHRCGLPAAGSGASLGTVAPPRWRRGVGRMALLAGPPAVLDCAPRRSGEAFWSGLAFGNGLLLALLARNGHGFPAAEGWQRAAARLRGLAGACRCLGQRGGGGSCWQRRAPRGETRRVKASAALRNSERLSGLPSLRSPAGRSRKEGRRRIGCRLRGGWGRWGAD